MATGLFNWGKRDAAPTAASAPAPDTGASAPADSSSQGSVSASTRNAAAETARAALRARRGPRRDTGNGATTDSALQEKINEQIASQLEALHAPELWESMLCMPADGMLALTGKERWDLSQKERKTMGLSGSALARTMMITNPRALAAFMFISVMSSAYLPRALGELKEIAAKRKGEKSDAKPETKV